MDEFLQPLGTTGHTVAYGLGRLVLIYNTSLIEQVFLTIPFVKLDLAGDDAREEELRSDEEIMETVMTNLRSMFPDVREPDSFVITRWGDVDTIAGGVSELNILGKVGHDTQTTDISNQYTSPMPGRDMADDIENLSRSLGRLYWAGEATAVAAWGSGEKRLQ